MNIEDLLALRRHLVVHPGLVQSKLLQPSSMQAFARERGVLLVSGETVTELWQAGLMRADLVMAKRGAEVPHGLEMVEEREEEVIFFDSRPVPHRETGYGGILAGVPRLCEVEPLFHPFRLYLLHHVHRVFKPMATATQFLQKPEGLINIARTEIDELDRWTKTGKCVERFEHWNHCCELPMLAEVVSHGRVYGYERLPVEISQDDFEAKKNDYRAHLFHLLRETPLEEIENVRSDLVASAEMLDGNKMLHVLLRLAAIEQRERLRDDIGAAMHYLAMAECVRRATEAALDQHLREEDELGFGQWIKGARKAVYGSERVLDSSPADRRDFMSSMGLDVGTKVRCYVEGDTECAALVSAIGDGGSVDFINLRGQFAEARGRGLAFAKSLAADKAARVFSIVAMDGDRSENLRVIRRAAEEERMFGPFYVASPDFELENFSVAELVSVVVELLREEGIIDLPQETDLLDRMTGVTSAKEFFAAFKDTPYARIDKGDRWGAALMKYALNNEHLPTGHRKAGKVRQVVEIARMIVQARQSGYLRSVERSRVDPATGEIVPRRAQDPEVRDT